MSNPIEIANDIKAAILELAGGRDYPDLLEAVDSLLIRSSNKGYAQGVIDGKAIGPESGEQLYRRIATYEGIGKIVATYEPVTCPAPAQAPHDSDVKGSPSEAEALHDSDVMPSSAVKASGLETAWKEWSAGTDLRDADRSNFEAGYHAAKSEPRAPVLPMKHNPIYPDEDREEQARHASYVRGWNDCLAAASQAPGAGGEG